MDARTLRIGQNEALFREVNERIERVTEAFEVTGDKIEILCECGDDGCLERLEVSLPEYERIRRKPALFFIRSGHEKPAVEDVVEQQEAYDVVRKKEGAPAEIARRLDPRRGHA